MITVNLLRKAYDAGVVKLVTDPDLEHGTVCQIGEHWFYFAGFSGESCPPEKYAEVTLEEDILREIMETLDFFREDRAFRTEYSYYDAVLNGWEKRKGKNSFTIVSGPCSANCSDCSLMAVYSKRTFIAFPPMP